MARRDDDDDDDDDRGDGRYSSSAPRRRRDEDDEDDEERPSSGGPGRRRRSDDDEDDDDLDVRGPRRDRAGEAEARVFPPALALMIIGGVSFVILLFYCPVNLFVLLNDPEHQERPKDERVEELLGAAVLVPLMTLSSLAVAMCAALMKWRVSYGGSMTGAILACIPCLSPCCFLGIPFGIWALVVLNDTAVKDWFHAERT
jgi:hypothetical protein